MKTQRLPPDSNLIPVTAEEEMEHLAIFGFVTVLIKQDGTRWRVIEPWERGERT